MIFTDSCLQAVHQLWANTLRTLLSLLGVAIGIYCIIIVLAAVDSLEVDIRASFDKLGGDVLYLSKMPWTENPHTSYWKYQRRPNPSYDDYEVLQRKLVAAKHVVVFNFVNTVTATYKTNAVNGIFLFATSPGYEQVYNLELDAGRYFSSYEQQRGSDCVVLGCQVAESLFGRVDPVGRNVKIDGRQLKVVGVITKSGDDLINPLDYDWCALVPYERGARMANLHSPSRQATVVAMPHEGMDPDDFYSEMVIATRAARRLNPKEDNNFSINSISVLNSLLEGFFSTLNLLGAAVGAFALLVGAFSVANIMFVSVRERTSQIGVKKALGAKSSVIMLEFLIESVVICLIGGVIGLLWVFVTTQILNAIFESFNFYLSLANIVWGLGISSVIGVIAGALPAFLAARMDPVVAIRK